MVENCHAPSVFEETQTIAYAIYQERGAEGGHAFEDWLAAEQQLRGLVNSSTAVHDEAEAEAEAPRTKVRGARSA